MMPVHAHLNLLGWVTVALYGTFYALTHASLKPRLAWTNFVLSAIGVVVMIPSLALYLPPMTPSMLRALSLASSALFWGFWSSPYRCFANWCALASSRRQQKVLMLSSLRRAKHRDLPHPSTSSG